MAQWLRRRRPLIHEVAGSKPGKYQRDFFNSYVLSYLSSTSLTSVKENITFKLWYIYLKQVKQVIISYNFQSTR